MESSKWVDTHLPNAACKCPVCGHTLNAATGEGSPSEDDLSVCIECTTFLRFDKNLMLVLLSDTELNALSDDKVLEIYEIRKRIQDMNFKF